MSVTFIVTCSGSNLKLKISGTLKKPPRLHKYLFKHETQICYNIRKVIFLILSKVRIDCIILCRFFVHVYNPKSMFYLKDIHDVVGVKFNDALHLTKIISTKH